MSLSKPKSKWNSFWEFKFVSRFFKANASDYFDFLLWVCIVTRVMIRFTIAMNRGWYEKVKGLARREIQCWCYILPSVKFTEFRHNSIFIVKWNGDHRTMHGIRMCNMVSKNLRNINRRTNPNPILALIMIMCCWSNSIKPRWLWGLDFFRFLHTLQRWHVRLSAG